MASPAPSVPLGIASRSRGQQPLTDECVAAICEHYGWRNNRLAYGYEDNNQVFIGSNYAGRVDIFGSRIILDREVRA